MLCILPTKQYKHPYFIMNPADKICQSREGWFYERNWLLRHVERNSVLGKKLDEVKEDIRANLKYFGPVPPSFDTGEPNAHL